MQHARGRSIRRSVVAVALLSLTGAACGAGQPDNVSAESGRQNASTTYTLRSEVPATEPSPACSRSNAPIVDPASGVPVTTTTIAPHGGCPTTSLPPGKVPCLIVYGTLLPGEEKDVPVYRSDTHEQIATIHLPDGTWTPGEAEEMCA
jgi:hypothetical protein